MRLAVAIEEGLFFIVMEKTFNFIQWLRAKNFISCTPQFIKETGSNSIVGHLEYLYEVFVNEFGNVNLDLRTILENTISIVLWIYKKNKFVGCFSHENFLPQFVNDVRKFDNIGPSLCYSLSY